MYTKIRPKPVEIPNYDPRMMDYMTYRNNITDPAPAKDPDIPYEIERHFLFVSSNMRDVSQYPDPAQFRVELVQPFNDVVSIELSAGVMPNQGNISNDGYLLLDIPEFNHIKTADGSKYFGILGLAYHPSPTREYYNLDKSNTNNMPVTFKPVKRRLDSFTINLRHPDGSLVSLGNESADAPFDLTLQTSFTFEVRTRVRRRTGIDRDERALPIMGTSPATHYMPQRQQQQQQPPRNPVMCNVPII